MSWLLGAQDFHGVYFGGSAGGEDCGERGRCYQQSQTSGDGYRVYRRGFVEQVANPACGYEGEEQSCPGSDEDG